MITFVLGGNASGKSGFAQGLFDAAPGPGVFVATGKARDMAFREQIAAHRRERRADLPVLEAGADLPVVLNRAKKDYAKILADSLDFWLFACLEAGGDPEELVRSLTDWSGPELFLVSCEIGLCPVAADAGTRDFVRRLGTLNRKVAEIADRVYLVAAGLPVTLKNA